MDRSGTTASNADGLRAALVRTPSGLRQILRLPFRLYRGDPLWIPPLLREEKRRLDPVANPFFKYGTAEIIGVFSQNNELLGRAAAIHNPRYIAEQGDSAGFFGMFECINDVKAAQLLMEAIRGRLRLKGCTSLIGPVTMTPNEEVGLLVEGFELPPMVLANYAPPYYATLLEASGLNKVIDLLTYAGHISHAFPPKYKTVLARVSSRSGLRLRPFDRGGWEGEIETIRTLYNRGFAGLWGHVPLTRAEALELGRLLRLSDEKLITIAECRGQPIGCILAALDLNEILKPLRGRLFPFGFLRLTTGIRSIRGVRVMVLCVLPEFRMRGVETLLIESVRTRMIERGCTHAEFSFVLENNGPMRRVLEGVGFKQTKRHRVYRGAIGEEPIEPGAGGPR